MSVINRCVSKFNHVVDVKTVFQECTRFFFSYIGCDPGGAAVRRSAAGQTKADSIPGWRLQPVPDHRRVVHRLAQQAGRQLPGKIGWSDASCHLSGEMCV